MIVRHVGHESDFALSSGASAAEPQRGQPRVRASIQAKHHGQRTGRSGARQYPHGADLGSFGAPQDGQR